MSSYTKSLQDLVAPREQAEKDAELIDAVLERDDLSDAARTAFEDMLGKLAGRGYALSAKQRAWVLCAARGERYEPAEEYENAFSAGRVPRGREVELLVRDKPLKPPGRR
jgi:hypothetical protein